MGANSSLKNADTEGHFEARAGGNVIKGKGTAYLRLCRTQKKKTDDAADIIPIVDDDARPPG